MLQKAGIAVQHALPGVGQNFQDHYIARISCYVRDLDTLNERARGLGFANEVMRYIVQGKGMMTFGASLCAASVKVLPESATPDVQCVFAPASYKPGLIRELDDRPGDYRRALADAAAVARLCLVRTPDPHDQPAINRRYLAEEPISARWAHGVTSAAAGQHLPAADDRVDGCGLHTRAVTVFRDPLSEGFRHFVASMPAPVASGWSEGRVGLAPTGGAIVSTVAACTLARSPYFVTRYPEGFRHFVTSMPAPVASGWSGCRAGLAPPGEAPPCHGVHPLRPVRCRDFS